MVRTFDMYAELTLEPGITRDNVVMALEGGGWCGGDICCQKVRRLQPKMQPAYLYTPGGVTG